MAGNEVKMNLLDVLEEVIEGYILPLLSWNDLLRLRRACWTTHVITTKYMRAHPDLAPELEINEGDKDVKAFLEMDIPTTKLFLDTEASGYAFFDKFAEELDALLKKYGHLIKSLRVKEFSLHLFGKEKEFLEGLKNLESFQADYFGAGTGKADISSKDFDKALTERLKLAKECPGYDDARLPETMRLLKHLSIGQKRNLPIANVLLYTLEVVSNCHQLEYVSLPFNTLIPPNPVIRDASEALALASIFFKERIRHNLESQEKSNLKVIDFSSYHDDFEDNPYLSELIALNGSRHLLALAALCMQSGVKLETVDACWFYHGLTDDNVPVPQELKSPELGHVIVSLININRAVIELDTPNLETIDIRRTSSIGLDEDIYGPVEPHWPALKCLKIHVDSNVIRLQAQLHHVFDMNQERMLERNMVQRTRDLFNIFFRNVRRLELVELKLTFQENTDVAVPKTEDIVNACPNLKKLTIGNWPGTNKALVTLWNGLPGLEEVVLENCKQLGNVAFVGEERERPAFLKLKHLRKLSLKELDKMPKLTDTLFTLVVRHLKLTHLTLTSGAPVESVTLAGLESMLDGPFAEHIEKMSFDGLSLKGVPSAELTKLEKNFRSFNML